MVGNLLTYTFLLFTFFHIWCSYVFCGILVRSLQSVGQVLWKCLLYIFRYLVVLSWHNCPTSLNVFFPPAHWSYALSYLKWKWTVFVIRDGWNPPRFIYWNQYSVATNPCTTWTLLFVFIGNLEWKQFT